MLKALILAGVASTTLVTAALAEDNFFKSEQYGRRNAIDSTQSGDHNTAGIKTTGNWIYQRGDDNALKISQGGSNNTIGANDVKKNGAITVSDQIGNRNTLDITQGGSNNTTKYRQNGDNNGTAATGPLTGTSGAPLLGSTYASTTGKWNTIEQTGTRATGSDIDIRQNAVGFQGGVGNGVIAKQNAASSTIMLNQQVQGLNGAPNLAYFDQQGSTNAATVTQTQFGTDRNLADIRQSGAGSTASATQTGSGLDLFVNQSVGNNRATTTQAFATDSFMQITQVGSASTVNSVNATQTNGAHMQLTVTQNGFGHTVESTQQFGNYLIASVEQTGNDNRYVGYQNGGFNTATVTQGNVGNLANVVQTGSNSTVTISQNRAR